MRPQAVENNVALSTVFVPKLVPNGLETGLEALITFSVSIGRDLMLTQGSTGNTSIKTGRTLWIKASGTWLMNAADRSTFVPLDLIRARDCIWRNADLRSALLPHCPDGLSPSIETAMHAVLPHRVVAHAHSVNSIAFAVCANAREHLRDRLVGIQWQWIPYVRSGTPLAWEVMRALERSPDADVFILGNHGLIVCGDSVGEAKALLLKVHSALALPVRNAPRFDEPRLWELSTSSGWAFPDRDIIHSLATDPVSKSILAGGVLYPCHEIFLGGSRAWNSLDCASLPFRIIPHCGVLVSPRITACEYLTLAGLAEVVQRIKPSATVNYLPEQEVIAARALSSYRSPGQG